MRKLFIMLVVMVVVFNMSAGVMAQELEEGTVNVNLSVDEEATIDINNNTIDINHESFGEFKGTTDVTVAANTAVDTIVTLEFDNWDEVFPNMGKDSVLWGGSNAGDNWIISPNVAIEGVAGSHAGGYSDLKTGFRMDRLSLDENGIVTDTFEVSSTYNKDSDWYKFDASKTLEARFVFTISAN